MSDVCDTILREIEDSHKAFASIPDQLVR